MFHGSIVALVTPMLADGNIDYAALEALLEWHIAEGTDAVVVLGTTGECPTIEPDERREIIRRSIKTVAGRIPVIVGTGANATRHAIELTREALELGADAGLSVTPYYNKPTQEGLYQHFKTIATAVPLPLILYNVPGRTGCDLRNETVVRLNEFANIVGLKDATGDMARVAELVAKGINIDLLSGDDPSFTGYMLAGGKGVISVTANVVPKKMHQICQALLSNQPDQAKAENDSLVDLHKYLCIESNPIPTKWVLEQMRKIQGGIRLPLTPLSIQHRATVMAALQKAGIKI